MRFAIALAAVALGGSALGGCGGPSEAEDEEAIREVLVTNVVGGPERCTEIYTDAYLAENWNENVTAYPGATPLEKCRNQPPLEGVGEDEVGVTVEALEGDAATASATVRSASEVRYTLVRDGDGWRIDGFAD